MGDGLRGIFGVVGLLLPWYLILFGVLIIANKTVHITGKSGTLMLIILLMLCLFNSGRFIDEENLAFVWDKCFEASVALKSGGVFGMAVGNLLVKFIGKVGLYVFSAVIILICLLLVINTPISRGIEALSVKADERKQERELRLAEKQERKSEKQERKSEKQECKAKKQAVKQNLMASDRYDEEQLKIITPYDDAGPLGSGGSDGASRTSAKEKKSSVLKYMNDNSLFSSEKKNDKGLGLDGETFAKGGYGLDGSSAKEKLSVLDAYKPPEGFGLDGNGAPQHAVHADKFVSASDMSGEFDTKQPHIYGVVTKEEEPRLSKKEASSITLSPEELAQGAKAPAQYRKPPITLLNKPQAKNRGNLNADLKMKAVKLEETLKNFNVDARVIQVTQGPAVTRYEIQPNVGVR